MKNQIIYSYIIKTTLIGGLMLNGIINVALAEDIIKPEPIPKGYNFPAPRNVIQKISDDRDIKAARDHAWAVWEGMNQASSIPTKSHSSLKYLPIWETWYGEEEITENITKPINEDELLEDRTIPPRTLKKPKQFSTLDTEQILSFNKFNPAAGRFIIEPHYSPAGKIYYNIQKDLLSLNESWAESTPLAERTISQFPPSAMETKPVFMLVKRDGLTALPYWQGPQGSTNPVQPTPSTWTTCVLIDPKSQDTIRVASKEQIEKGANTEQAPNCKSYRYAGLSQIYYFQLDTNDQANSFNTAQFSTLAEKGDYAVLVGMHINTKEIVNWTWQTFFWTGGETPPNDYPGSMSNIPSTLSTPWNNYAMCTAYWQENKDGSIHTCFNPHLETATSGIPDGLNSNCMSCHGTARTSPLHNNQSAVPKYPQNYNREIQVGPEHFSPLYFKGGSQGNTRTDFSWAIGGIGQ